jgi:hypothetical protein
MKTKVHNFVAKDLRSPKYRMRIVESKKKYSRKVKNISKTLD